LRNVENKKGKSRARRTLQKRGKCKSSIGLKTWISDTYTGRKKKGTRKEIVDIKELWWFKDKKEKPTR